MNANRAYASQFINSFRLLTFHYLSKRIAKLNLFLMAKHSRIFPIFYGDFRQVLITVPNKHKNSELSTSELRVNGFRIVSCYSKHVSPLAALLGD